MINLRQPNKSIITKLPIYMLDKDTINFKELNNKYLLHSLTNIHGKTFNIGDKVRVQSEKILKESYMFYRYGRREGFNDNSDIAFGHTFASNMFLLCDKTFTIASVTEKCYTLHGVRYNWNGWMFK